MSEKSYTLAELTGEVKNCIEKRFSSTVWVIAEINRLTINRSGHCYLELVQKSSGSDKIIASSRGTIWASKFPHIKAYFETATGAQLTNGISVLIKVSVDFHQMYGFSLNIRDIDPAYTLGDIARRRKEIIDRLESENIINMNKSIPLQRPITRIAVISSAGAAGYEDFINQLTNNKFGYKYNITLFEASMQGDKTEKSIISALNIIFDTIDNYDCISIIRGGGSKSDLAAFDNYNIAFHITQIPIPVLTGIGHERDESVTDIVAHTKLKTPTAVAEFIIESCESFESTIDNIGSEIAETVKDKLYVNELILTQASIKISKLSKNIRFKQDECNQLVYRLKHALSVYFQQKNSKLEFLKSRKIIYSREFVKSNNRRLSDLSNQVNLLAVENIGRKLKQIEVIEKNIKLTDPVNVLKRGFSITKSNNKIISNSRSVKSGDEIITIFHDSALSSKVTKKTKT